MKRAAAAILFAAAGLGAVPAWAHHSFAASYDEKQSITIEGTSWLSIIAILTPGSP